MLFRAAQHQAIADGRITRTVRAWSRPKVKVGGRYAVWTIGLVEVDRVQTVRWEDLSDEDGARSGFGDRAGLEAELRRTSRKELGPGSELVRVDFHFAGPDERPDPGAEDHLDPEALATLRKKLDGMDRRSASGPWTRATLAAIAAAPGRGSKHLAVDLGRERARLKADVRKLKKLGLTRSLEVGYALGPRGVAFLEAEEP